ncbi:EAL domain-containing response regulator [Usitatibacter palustris]|uniref:Sensor histidine kinase RcsC n=1 Tax=Usitatibacter palustris TaxID=2732487 RepID=A0A6M4H745_9PROT|nr:EAL domain-containing response regulator [Usitatibacter palustris]QJR14503.1 Sensor histidine kinase RcsC [Usitatibacter palustris]
MINGLRFLVVEDHAFQRWLIGSLLDGLGAESVHLASDGTAGLRTLAKAGDQIDIVVSDLDMPGMDGMQLIRHMGERRHPASLIVLSAMQSPLLASVEAMAREYGVTFLAAIPKPLTARKLQAALDLHRPRPEVPARAPLPRFTPVAIAQGLERGEFEPYFLPRVDIATGCIRGAEALARWNHPTQGRVQPEAFIPVVETRGFMESLTNLMVCTATAHCRTWRDLDLDLSVSINISSTLLGDGRLADRLTELVAAAGIEPRHVTFEITETAATRNLGRTLENLTRLRMYGFGLAIDDYGTGYSSMQRLVNMPFTELKIDKTFVTNAAREPSSRAMVESSLELARKLGLTTIAEGVEDREAWELLRSMGCPQAQGYFIAAPMPAAEFLTWAHEQKQLPGASWSEEA